MTKADFQRWLNARALDRALAIQALVIDGDANPKAIGPKTLAMFDAVMTNREAPAVDDADRIAFANRLDCTLAAIHAIAEVETNGGGFDALGRPKVLFERHKFWFYTRGRFGPSGISNPNGGGYGSSASQWSRLHSALRLDPDAALRSCSWGAFQVMGFHAEALGYPSPADMAFTMVLSEADHYEAMARFIEANGLDDELRAGGRTEASWTRFALLYNGKRQNMHDYDGRLASSWRRAAA